MNTALGLSFGRDRVFLVQCSREADGVHVHDATSAAPLTTLSAQSTPSSGTTVMRVAESLRAALAALPHQSRTIGVALPASWVFVHTFPAPSNAPSAMLQERSAWEVAQHFGIAKPDDVAATVFPLMRDQGSYLSIAYPKQVLVRLHELFDAMGLDMASTAVDLLSAERTLRHSYADIAAGPVAIIECGGLGGSVSVMREHAVSVLAQHPQLESAAGVVSALEQAEGRAGYHATEIMVWGEVLTSDLLGEIEARLPLRRVRRLNAFRGLIPDGLNERVEAYIRRTAHLFPAAVGAALEALDREPSSNGRS